MKKLLVIVFISISSSLFAFQSGMSVYGLYDFTNKIDVRLSGLDFVYNYKEAPGIGLSIADTSGTVGFSLDVAYYFEKTLDTVTAFGLTVPFATPLPKFYQIVMQANALFKLNEVLFLFGGVNYPNITYTNTSDKVSGELGYQGGLMFGTDLLSCKLTYQVLNGTLVTASNVTSEKYTSTGLIASVALSI
ncbi:MAG: hypothetical protein A2Y40_00225 [Candidatus Margulisbacteria bacterium GWF2_35_9]|nr:MAG: hypothetical protein A2Y40_00225 [Candidatus Margulisbacteria bacterium GWF2_35_9]